MSFTFSHPAVVLPLMSLPKKWRSTTGLVMGSMVPDFEKFINMSEHDPHSHTWWGIFYFDLPLGLLLCFLFHLLVRDPLVHHLPGSLRRRFQQVIGLNWWAYFKQHYGVVLLSLFVGILSHLALDILTHTPGHREELFPFVELGSHTLTNPISEQMDLRMQIITSFIGLLALGWWILRLPQTPETDRPRHDLRYWLLVTVITLAVIALRTQIGDGIKLDPYHPSIVLISAGLTSLLISPVLLRLWSYFK